MNDSLNLTGKNSQQAQDGLLAAFKGLAGDGRLEIIADFDLRPALLALQEVAWGAFNWFPLEDGPDCWRVDLAHLDPQVSPRKIGEFMSWDHKRCDDLFIFIEEASQAGDDAKVKKIFAEFVLGMEHHFKIEEEAFFPAFEQATGMTQGPTMMMRMEHQQMRGLMTQMGDAVANGDGDAISSVTSTLMVIMRQHNIKEEQMLYQMGDMHLSGESDSLLRKAQAF